MKRADIGSGAVNSAKVVDGSLTGVDINEPTLDGVDADTVGGLSAEALLRADSVLGTSKRAAEDMPDCNPGLEYLTRTINAPSNGWVVANAAFTAQNYPFAGGGAIAMRIEQTSPFARIGEWMEETVDTAGKRYSMSATQLFPVSAGSNTFIVKVCDGSDTQGTTSTAIAAQMTFVFAKDLLV